MHGYYEFFGGFGANSFVSGLRGPSTIEFADGTSLRFNAPDFKIGGSMYGDRTVEPTGSIVLQDLKNKLKAVVVLGTYKEAGFWSKTVSGSKTDVEGLIYSVKPDNNRPIKYGKDQKLPQEIKSVDDIKDKICNLSGNILQEFRFDNKVYWNIDTDQPQR